MNRGGVGARSVNIELQAALNPTGERKIERFGWTFAPGDKIMQIENDYDKEVYNGDTGFVADVETDAFGLQFRLSRKPIQVSAASLCGCHRHPNCSYPFVSGRGPWPLVLSTPRSSAAITKSPPSEGFGRRRRLSAAHASSLGILKPPSSTASRSLKLLIAIASACPSTW